VTDTPDDNKIIVFSSGMFIGLNILTPRGGHLTPKSGVGEILLWKNAQKNEKKNKISDTIKKITPNLIPIITFIGWEPSKFDSRNTSRHHWIEAKMVVSKHIRRGTLFLYCLKMIVECIIPMADKEATKGHGLSETIWNGWIFFIN